MNQLDDTLSRLSQLPMPEAMEFIEENVFIALAIRQRDAAASRPLMGVAVIVALGLGVAGGSLLSGPAVAASSLSPLAPASVLAPSSLLDSAR